jgi:outer membrane protein TolC
MARFFYKMLLQLQLEQLKAKKALAAAQRDVEVAGLSLRSYSGLQGDEKLVLEETRPQNPPDADAAVLLSEALANRADAIAFSRRKLEAERGVAKAKGDNGVNLTLSANLGVSNSSVDLEGVLRNPQDYQTVRLQLDVPVLDWGRSKSRIKTAQANRQLTEYAIQQDQQTFRQEIITAVSLYQLLKNQLDLNVQTDRIAQEQYEIARERYVLGNLNVMDLSLSFAEKDRARRDYIGALRDYWISYFSLRRLTLFDFDKKQRLGE